MRGQGAQGQRAERPSLNRQFKVATPLKALIVSASYLLYLFPGLLPSCSPTPPQTECEDLRAGGLASLGHCSVLSAYNSARHIGGPQ